MAPAAWLLLAALLVPVSNIATADEARADASDVVVSLAYADTHHGSSGRFPSPWMGSPGVVFVGSSSYWDAGAIRIDNPSSAPVAGVSVTVDISRHHWAIWPTNMTIPAHTSLILTETAPDNFDTSDRGFPGPCDKPSTLIPLVNVTIGSTTTVFRDTAQILNTDGVNRSSCPYPTDASHPWQQVGASPPPDAPPVAALKVTPGSGSAPLTTTADASASTDADATPIATYRFDFGDGTVAGPQSAATATHTYSSPGAYAVGVTVSDTGGLSSTKSASVTVIGFPSYIINGHDAGAASGYGFNLLDVGPSTIGNVQPGVQAIVWVGDFNKSTCAFDVSDATLAGIVAALAGDPRVYAYFIADEPDNSTCANVPSLLQARTNLIHSIDPAARSFSVVEKPANFAQYVPTIDIAGIDPYPCKANQPCDWTKIPTYAAAIRATGATRWFGVIQGFGSGGWRWPTAEEAHTIIRQWCASGWSGAATFAWTWNGESLTDHPEVLHEIQTLNTQGCNPFTDDPPVAALTVTPGIGAAPLPVTADASGSTDIDVTPIATYTFVWGDGTSTLAQPTPTATHTFATTGSYSVTVTVTDTAGLTASTTALVTVALLPPPDSPPAAALIVTPASGPAPLSVTADASGSTDIDTTPIATCSFAWGDSTTTPAQTAALATHSYSAPGTYIVTVTVTDTAGLSATKSAAVSALGNLIGNPGFETDTTRWNTIVTGTSLQRVSGGHSGNWSAQLTNTGTSVTTLGLNDSPNWITSTSAATYTASLWVRASTAGAVLKLKVREYSGSTLVGSQSASITLSTEWQRVSLTYAPAAPGSSSLDYQAYVSSAPPGATFLADDASITAI
jgi:PKD repeat protein